MANNKHCKNSAQWFENRIDPMARTQGEREREFNKKKIFIERDHLIGFPVFFNLPLNYLGPKSSVFFITLNCRTSSEIFHSVSLVRHKTTKR